MCALFVPQQGRVLTFLMLAFCVDGQQNSLTGSIPPSLGNLAKLLSLDLFVSGNAGQGKLSTAYAV